MACLFVVLYGAKHLPLGELLHFRNAKRTAITRVVIVDAVDGWWLLREMTTEGRRNRLNDRRRHDGVVLVIYFERYQSKNKKDCAVEMEKEEAKNDQPRRFKGRKRVRSRRVDV